MRLIDADALIKSICTEQCGERRKDCDARCEYVTFVDNAPTVNAKPKKPYESRRKLPCPKCGKRPSVWCVGDDSGKPMEFVACEKCKTVAEASYTTIGAIRNWNEVVRSWKA